MRRVAAVGVDDDLAPGEAGVGLRSADLEPARRVHQHPHARGVEVGELPQDRVDDLGLDVGLRAASRRRPLRGAGREISTVSTAHRAAVLVLDRDLALAVGAQVGNDARLADVGEAPRQPVRHGDRQRHQLLGLTAREAEHHALVAGAEVVERRRRSAPARCSSASSTPRAMSGDCSWIAVITPHVSPSSPNLASV